MTPTQFEEEVRRTPGRRVHIRRRGKRFTYRDWLHIAFVRRNGETRYYIDGNLVGIGHE